MNKINLKNYLRKFRKENQLNQAYMSELFGISQVQYSNIENGVTPIKIDYAKKLADLYGLNLNVLLGIEQITIELPKQQSKKIFTKSYDQVNEEVKKRFIEQVNKYGIETGNDKPLKLAQHLKINVEFLHQMYTESKAITLFKIYRLSNLIPSINLDYTFRNTGPLLIIKKK